MPSTPVIAVLDIGKTNKKLFLFDELYNTVWEKTDVLAETTDEDGFPCEDLNGLNSWIVEALSASGKTGVFDLRAINFSAYGASFVHIGSAGEPLTALYSYLKPYPEELKKRFYNQYGGESAFPIITASPVLGSLNSGMQLYRIQNEQPELFAKIRYSLHLPQWLSWTMTGNASSDITSIGCHTNLWNFPQNCYHEWVFREGIVKKLPPIYPSGKIYPCTPRAGTSELSNLPGIGFAGIGLHDSSAALIPYLESFSEPFVLISTGTWCISMNPFNKNVLTISELENDCLCYLSYDGKPVKASRLFAGLEHEQQLERMAVHYQKNKNYFQTVFFDPVIASRLKSIEEPEEIDRQVPSNTNSKFVFRDLAAFESFELAYHRLMMDIIVLQVASTRLILTESVTKIFVDGGFARNSVYMHLLAKAFPLLEVFASHISRASAIGAAMAIHEHWNGLPLPRDIIELKYFES
jgi:sugar (pentulose or hexulose) kinase